MGLFTLLAGAAALIGGAVGTFFSATTTASTSISAFFSIFPSQLKPLIFAVITISFSWVFEQVLGLIGIDLIIWGINLTTYIVVLAIGALFLTYLSYVHSYWGMFK